MEMRALGNTGLTVSALGLGAGAVGELSEEEAAAFLGGALDLGVALIDTARSYGASEERIGRHLAHRRGEFVLSTKCGYGIEGVPDWTGACIERGVDEALRRMRTDRIDVMHLHSCPLDVLRREDILDAMRRAVRLGKVRVAAYSGEGEALQFAMRCGVFGSVQTSVSICDQPDLSPARGLGLLAKRPLANAVWRFSERPSHDGAAAAYWDRLRAMRLEGVSQDLAIRFAAFAPGVSSALVGTRSLDHLRANAESIDRGALPESAVAAIRSGFKPEWSGQI
jgi:aryl-alcohol dehydrogenase-like predicted oxidoreductase